MFVITIDGILRQADAQIPVPPGMALYQALCSQGRVTLLGSIEGPEKDQYFLNTQNLVSHAMYLPYRVEAHPTAVGQRIAQVVRARGIDAIDFAVDPDPRVVSGLYEKGIAACLFLHPKFTSLDFRPDYQSKAQPWEEMVKVVDYQTELKAKQKPLYVYEEAE